MKYVEFASFANDYAENDVLVLDHVKDISPLYIHKPTRTLIAMCNQGWQKISANDNIIEIKVGDVLICPPNITIEGGEVGDDFECKAMCLSDHIVQALLYDRIDVWHHAVYVNQLSVVRMSQVCREEFTFYYALIRSKLLNNEEESQHEILQTLLRSMLLEICVALENTNGMKKEHKMSQGKVLFNRFISLLSNSKVKRLPISYYAGQLAITPKYLTMICLKYSNKTASEWVVQYTLEEIRFYLKNTDLSIKEISAKLGFSNMSHFGSYVRKHLGISPSEYRYKK